MQPEQNPSPQHDQLAALQLGRFNSAVASSDKLLRSTFTHDRIQNPQVEVTKVRNDGFEHYMPSFTANNLIGLEALGVDVPQALDTVRQSPRSYDAPQQTILTHRSGNEQLEVLVHENAFKLKFNIDGVESDYSNTDVPTGANELVKQRFAQSPAHQALARANQQLKQADETPHGFIMESFDPTIDPIGTLAFLEDIGMTSGLDYRFREGMTAAELLENVGACAAYGVTQTENEATHIFDWEQEWTGGVLKSLTIDKQTGAYQFEVVQDPAARYLEQGNQTQERAVPFIETECARELCSVLDNAGLMFHPQLQSEMMDLGEADRYGSIYTQLSREVAKWVDNPDRTALRNVFVPAEAARDYDADDGEQAVRQRWAAVPHTAHGEAATTLLGMIDSSLARVPGAEQPSDLPVTHKEVKIRDGACFDVTSYYIGAAGGRNGLRTIDEGGVKLLEKTMGSHTFMSTEPLVFNGVQLPKGALFNKNDDGYAFTRLTMFAFDNPADQIAVAGSELAKTQASEEQTLRAIGGTTLNHLLTQRL
jgi:hypothetical protein